MRQDLAQRAVPLLPAKGEIQQVFICQAAPSFAFFIATYVTGLGVFWSRYRCVAVTGEAIYVLESSRWSGGSRPRRLIGTMPRTTRLGPVSGRWAELSLLGQRHWVHQRFHADIRAADREAGVSE